MRDFHSHEQALGHPLRLSRLGVTSNLLACRQEVREPTKEDAVALNKTGRAKGEARKTHIGFRLSADVVEKPESERPRLQRQSRTSAARGRIRGGEKGDSKKGRRQARPAREKAGMT